MNAWFWISLSVSFVLILFGSWAAWMAFRNDDYEPPRFGWGGEIR